MSLQKAYEFKGKEIGYLDYGSGKPIMLIHGYLETADIWHSFAMKLAEKGYRVLAPHLPGHGSSDLYGPVHTLEFMSDSLKGLISHLGLQKVFMAGHSMGGYITLAFGELYGELLAGYGLIHSHPFADTPQALEKRKNEILMAEKEKQDKFIQGNIERMYAPENLVSMHEAVLRSKEIASTISGECIASVLRGMMLRPSRLSVLENKGLPFLWILGEKDNYINYSDVLKKVKLPVNSESYILKNSGHMGFVEEEVLTVKLLTDFAGPLL